jgi:electron transfer flavoprotein beta subunit
MTGTGFMRLSNPFDEYAIEVALRIKDESVVWLSDYNGASQAEAALRSAIAMGDDDGYLISDRCVCRSDTWLSS